MNDALALAITIDLAAIINLIGLLVVATTIASATKRIVQVMREGK
jgi:hypothetical protein